METRLELLQRDPRAARGSRPSGCRPLIYRLQACDQKVTGSNPLIIPLKVGEGKGPYHPCLPHPGPLIPHRWTVAAWWSEVTSGRAFDLKTIANDEGSRVKKKQVHFEGNK